MEKPKLTREQAEEIYGCAGNPAMSPERFIFRLFEAGYMEKPETAFERAERLYDEYETKIFGTKTEELRFQGDIIELYREAIKEMQTALDAAGGK